MSDDYGPAIWKPADSRNYSEARFRISNDGKDHSFTRDDLLDSVTKIIIHKVEGSFEACWRTFQDPGRGASCQYVVAHGGDVAQCVREFDVAWQAGYWPWNRHSIGIEHEGFTARDDVTDRQYHASARLLAHLCKKFTIPIDRKHIKAHHEVPGCEFSGGGFGCHTDPGDHWRWRHYLGLARRYREEMG